MFSRRCSTTPPSVSTTRLPWCVVGCAGNFHMLGVSSSDIQLRRRRRLHQPSRCYPRLVAGTPTRHVACGTEIVPLEVQALPLPVLRVVGRPPTSVQIRCTSHSGSTQLHHCRSQVPILLSAPTRSSHSASVKPIEVITTSSDDEVVTTHNHVQISLRAPRRKHDCWRRRFHLRGGIASA